MKHPNQKLILLFPLLLLGLAAMLCRSPKHLDAPTPLVETKKSSPPGNIQFDSTDDGSKTEHDLDGFVSWLTQFLSLPLDSPEKHKMIQAGLELAKKRRPHMEWLIRQNPRRALEESLCFSDWAALPDEIKAEVERPFSVDGAYTYYPICRQPDTLIQPGAATFMASLAMPNGENLQTFPYGRRDGVFSKRSLPVQGISLSGMAVMRDSPLQILNEAEAATANTWFTNGQNDMTRSIVSGLPVGETPTLAVSGGRLYAFANLQEAESLDSQLAELDSKPGPFAASSLLASPSEVTSNGSLDLPKIQSIAVAQASSWTETKKRLFLIRVNFTDRPEEPVTKAAAEDEMGKASERIREMSYGKTWVEFAASANIYTMPKTFAYYDDGTDRLWGELLRDARNTFRQMKSGQDATINIGPISDLYSGNSNGLGNYDIIGIFRYQKTR